MKKMYQKLVRDRIPDLFTTEGKTCVSRVMTEEEYKTELLKKVIEEAHETMGAANDKEHLVKELADLLEAIECVEEVFGVTKEEVEQTKKELQQRKGSFRNKIYLESAE